MHVTIHLYLLGDRCGPHQQDPLPVHLLCLCCCFLENSGRLKSIFSSCFCWKSPEKLLSLFLSRPQHAYRLDSLGYMFSSWYDDINLNNFPLSTVNNAASCWSYQECDNEWSRWNIMLQRWNYFHSSRWRCCGKDSLLDLISTFYRGKWRKLQNKVVGYEKHYFDEMIQTTWSSIKDGKSCRKHNIVTWTRCRTLFMLMMKTSSRVCCSRRPVAHYVHDEDLLHTQYVTVTFLGPKMGLSP